MIRHLATIIAITVLIIACQLLPFLPGDYDGSAVMLSTVAQILGVVELVMVPIGAVWLVYEFRKHRRKKAGLKESPKSYYFALTSLIAGSIVLAMASFGAFITLGKFSGLIILALLAYLISRIIRQLKRLRHTADDTLNPVPVYLVLVPLLVALFQYTVLDRAVEFSRNRAISNSAKLIDDIEQYYKTHGSYPPSLPSLWNDYRPFVVGVDRYHYSRRGNAYSISFEQLSNIFGTREIVMYNKLDEHFIPSHDSAILLYSPEQLFVTQGYYAVNDAPVPHWKYFWFD